MRQKGPGIVPTSLVVAGAATILLLTPGCPLGCPAGGGPGPARADVESYDPVTDIWSQESPMPVGIWMPGCTVMGTWIYVGGGWSGAFLRYDTLAGTWEELPGIPTPRTDHAIVALGTDLYILGGSSGETPVDVFDTVGDTWSTGPSLSGAHESLEAVELGGWIYALAGRTDVVEALDPVSGTWQTVAPLPNPLRYFAAETDGVRIYVMGGEYTEASGGNRTTKEVWLYDPITDQWTAGVPLPLEDSLVGAARIGQEIFVLGFTQTPLSLDIVSGTWTWRTPKNKGLTGVGVAAGGGRLYVFGGI